MVVTLITPVRKRIAKWFYTLHPVWQKKIKITAIWCLYNALFFLTRARREEYARRITALYLNYGFEFNKAYAHEVLDIDKDFFTRWVAERDLYMYNLSLRDRKKYKIPFISASRPPLEYPLAFEEEFRDANEYFAMFALDFSLDVQYAGRASLIYLVLKRWYENFMKFLVWSVGYAYFMWRRFVFPGLRFATGLIFLGAVVLFVLSPLYWCGPGLSWALRRRFGIPIHVSWAHVFLDFCSGPGYIILATLLYLVTGLQVSRVHLLCRSYKKGISRIPFIRDMELQLIPVKLAWIKLTTPAWNAIYAGLVWVRLALIKQCRRVFSWHWYKEKFWHKLIWPADEKSFVERPYILFVLGFKLVGTRPWSFLWHLGGRISYYIAWEAKNLRRFLVPKIGFLHKGVGSCLAGLLACGIWLRALIIRPKPTLITTLAGPFQNIISLSNFVVKNLWPGAAKPTAYRQAQFWARSVARVYWATHYLCRVVVDGAWFAMVTATGVYLIIVILGPLGARGCVEWVVIFLIFARDSIGAVRAVLSVIRAKKSEPLKSLKAVRLNSDIKLRTLRNRLSVHVKGVARRAGQSLTPMFGFLQKVWIKKATSLLVSALGSVIKKSWVTGRVLKTAVIGPKDRVARLRHKLVSKGQNLLAGVQTVSLGVVMTSAKKLLSILVFLSRLSGEIACTLLMPLTYSFKAVYWGIGCCDTLLRAVAGWLTLFKRKWKTGVEKGDNFLVARKKLWAEVCRGQLAFISTSRVVVTTGKSLVLAPVRLIDSVLTKFIHKWLACERFLLEALLNSRKSDQLVNMYFTSNGYMSWLFGCIGWVWWQLLWGLQRATLWVFREVLLQVWKNLQVSLASLARVVTRAAKAWFTASWSVTLFLTQTIKRLLWLMLVWPAITLGRIARGLFTKQAAFLASLIVLIGVTWAAWEQLRFSSSNVYGHIDTRLLISQLQHFSMVLVKSGYITFTYVSVNALILVWQLLLFIVILLLLSSSLLLISGVTYAVLVALRRTSLYIWNGLRHLYLFFSEGSRWRKLSTETTTEPKQFRGEEHSAEMLSFIKIVSSMTAISYKLTGFSLFALSNGLIANYISSGSAISNGIFNFGDFGVKIVLLAGLAVFYMITLWAAVTLIHVSTRTIMSFGSTLVAAFINVIARLALFLVKAVIIRPGMLVYSIGLWTLQLVKRCWALVCQLKLTGQTFFCSAARRVGRGLLVLFVTSLTSTGWAFLRRCVRLLVFKAQARKTVARQFLLFKARDLCRAESSCGLRRLVQLVLAYLVPPVLTLGVWLNSLYHFALSSLISEALYSAYLSRSLPPLTAFFQVSASRSYIKIWFAWRKLAYWLSDRPVGLRGYCFTGKILKTTFQLFWQNHCQPHTLLLSLCSLPGACLKAVFQLVKFYAFVFLFLPFEVALLGLAQTCVYWTKVRSLIVNFYYFSTDDEGSVSWKCRPFWRLVLNHIYLILVSVLTGVGLSMWGGLEISRFIFNYVFWCLGALFQALVGALALGTKTLPYAWNQGQRSVTYAIQCWQVCVKSFGAAVENVVFAGWRCILKPKLISIWYRRVVFDNAVDGLQRYCYVTRTRQNVYKYKQVIWERWHTPLHVLGYYVTPHQLRAYCFRHQLVLRAETNFLVNVILRSPLANFCGHFSESLRNGLKSGQAISMLFLTRAVQRLERCSQVIHKLLQQSHSQKAGVEIRGGNSISDPVRALALGSLVVRPSSPTSMGSLYHRTLRTVDVSLVGIIFVVGLGVSILTSQALLWWVTEPKPVLRWVQHVVETLQQAYCWVAYGGVLAAIGLLVLWCIIGLVFWLYYGFQYWCLHFISARMVVKRLWLAVYVCATKTTNSTRRFFKAPTRSVATAGKTLLTLWSPLVKHLKLKRILAATIIRQRSHAFFMLRRVRCNLVLTHVLDSLLKRAVSFESQKVKAFENLTCVMLRDWKGLSQVRKVFSQNLAHKARAVFTHLEAWVDNQIAALLPKKLKPKAVLNLKESWPGAYKLPKGPRPKHLVLSGFWHKDIRKQIWSDGKREWIVRLYTRSAVYLKSLPIHFWGPAFVETLFWVIFQLAFPFSFWRVLRRTIRWRFVNLLKRMFPHGPTFKIRWSRWWPVSSWAFNRDVFRWYVFWTYNPMHLDLVLHSRVTASRVYPVFRWFCSLFPLNAYDRLARRLRVLLMAYVWRTIRSKATAFMENIVKPIYVLIADYAIKYGLLFERFNWFIRYRLYGYVYFRLVEYFLRWPFVKPTLQWTTISLICKWVAKQIWKVASATVLAILRVSLLSILITFKTWLSFTKVLISATVVFGSLITRQLKNDALYSKWSKIVYNQGRIKPLVEGQTFLTMAARLPWLAFALANYGVLSALTWLVLCLFKIGHYFLIIRRTEQAEVTPPANSSDLIYAQTDLSWSQSKAELLDIRAKVWAMGSTWLYHRGDCSSRDQTHAQPSLLFVPKPSVEKSRHLLAGAITVRRLWACIAKNSDAVSLTLWGLIGGLVIRRQAWVLGAFIKHIIVIDPLLFKGVGFQKIETFMAYPFAYWHVRCRDRFTILRDHFVKPLLLDGVTKTITALNTLQVELRSRSVSKYLRLTSVPSRLGQHAHTGIHLLRALISNQVLTQSVAMVLWIKTVLLHVRRALEVGHGRGLRPTTILLRGANVKVDVRHFANDYGRSAAARKVECGLDLKRSKVYTSLTSQLLGLLLPLTLDLNRKIVLISTKLFGDIIWIPKLEAGISYTVVSALQRLLYKGRLVRVYWTRQLFISKRRITPEIKVKLRTFVTGFVALLPNRKSGIMNRFVHRLLYGFLRLPVYTAKVWVGNVLMLLLKKRFGTKLLLDFDVFASRVEGWFVQAVNLTDHWDVQSPVYVARLRQNAEMWVHGTTQAFVSVNLWLLRYIWNWLDHWFMLESGIAVLLADFKWEYNYTPPKRRTLVPVHVRLILYIVWLWLYVPTISKAIYSLVDYTDAKAHFVKHWELGCNELWEGVGKTLASTKTYTMLTAPRSYIMALDMRQARVNDYYLGKKRLLSFQVTMLRHVLVKRWDWRPRTGEFVLYWLVLYLITFKNTVGRGVGMFIYHVANAILGFIWRFIARSLAIVVTTFVIHMLRTFWRAIETIPHFLLFLPVYTFVITPIQAFVTVYLRRDSRVWLVGAIILTLVFLKWVWLDLGLHAYVWNWEVAKVVWRIALVCSSVWVMYSPGFLDICQLTQLTWFGVGSIWWFGLLTARWKGRPIKAIVPIVLLWYYVHIYDYGTDDYDVAAYAFYLIQKADFIWGGEVIAELLNDFQNPKFYVYTDAYDHAWVRTKLSNFVPYLWIYLFIPFQFQCLFPWFVTHWEPDPETYHRKMSTPFVEVWRPIYTFWFVFFVGFYKLHFVEIASDFDIIFGQVPKPKAWPYYRGAYKSIGGIEKIRAFIEYHDVQVDVPVFDSNNLTTGIEADWASVWALPGGWSERYETFFYNSIWHNTFYTADARRPRFGGANVDPLLSAEFVPVHPVFLESALYIRGPSQPMEFQTYHRRLWWQFAWYNEFKRDWKLKPKRRIIYKARALGGRGFLDFRYLFLPKPHTKVVVQNWVYRSVGGAKILRPLLENYYHGPRWWDRSNSNMDRENWGLLLRTMGLGLTLEEVAAPLIFENSTFFENQFKPEEERKQTWFNEMKIIHSRYFGPYNMIEVYDEENNDWDIFFDPKWNETIQESPYRPWAKWWRWWWQPPVGEFSWEAFLPLRPHKRWDLGRIWEWYHPNHPKYTRNDILGDFLYREWLEFDKRYPRRFAAFVGFKGHDIWCPSEKYSRLWYNIYVPPVRVWWHDHHEDGGIIMLPQLDDPELRWAMMREWIPRRSKATDEFEHYAFLLGEEAFPYPPKSLLAQLYCAPRLNHGTTVYAHVLDPDQVDTRSAVMLFPQVEDAWKQAELHNDSPSWEEWSGNPREESAVTWWDAAHGGWEAEAFDENPLSFEYALFKHDGTPWNPSRGEFKAVPDALSRQSSVKAFLEVLTYERDPWLTLPYRKEYWRVWRWDELEPWEHLDQQKLLWKFLDYIRRWFIPTELVIWVVTGQCYIDIVMATNALYWEYVFLWRDWYKYIFKEHAFKAWMKYLKRHNVLL